MRLQSAFVIMDASKRVVLKYGSYGSKELFFFHDDKSRRLATFTSPARAMATLERTKFSASEEVREFMIKRYGRNWQYERSNWAQAVPIVVQTDGL